MRVNIRGRVFDSVANAAEWAEVSPATIYSAMHRGTTDTVGVGGGRRGFGRGKSVTLWGR